MPPSGRKVLGCKVPPPFPCNVSPGSRYVLLFAPHLYSISAASSGTFLQCLRRNFYLPMLGYSSRFWKSCQFRPPWSQMKVFPPLLPLLINRRRNQWRMRQSKTRIFWQKDTWQSPHLRNLRWKNPGSRFISDPKFLSFLVEVVWTNFKLSLPEPSISKVSGYRF